MKKTIISHILGEDGEQYLLCAMDHTDYHLQEAYCSLLSDLTAVSPISQEAWEAAFSAPDAEKRGAWVVTYILLHRKTGQVCPTEEYLHEIEPTQLAGTARLVFERKLIRGGVLAGHLEDVVIARQYQGRGLGARLVQAVMEQAQKAGCYKVMLHCREDLEFFYAKATFQRHAIGMACRFPNKSNG